MTKKQMQARIAELETMVETLTTTINAMRTPLYVGPAPAPIVNPAPVNPFTPYMPMPSGYPPYPPWGSTTICGGTINGRQA